MIRMITGVPGSGKSYYAVDHIRKSFFKWDDDLDCHVATKKNIILTNIDDLRLPHLNLDEVLQERGLTFDELFTVPEMEKFTNEYPDHHICILLDEAQRFLPAGYRNTDVLFYFQYHRHLGHDVYLLAQTSESVCKHVNALLEFEIKSVRDTVKSGKYFKYSFVAGDLELQTKNIPHNPKVFALYTSFKKSDDAEKLNPMRSLYIKGALLLVLLVSLGVFSYNKITGYINPEAKADESVKKEQIKSKKINNPARVNTLKTINSQVKKRDKLRSLGTREREIERDQRAKALHFISCGGMWVGQTLVAVEFFGDFIMIDDLPYTYRVDDDRKRVDVAVPATVLAQVSKPLPVGSGNKLYKNVTGDYAKIGEESLPSRPDRDDNEPENPDRHIRTGTIFNPHYSDKKPLPHGTSRVSDL